MKRKYIFNKSIVLLQFLNKKPGWLVQIIFSSGLFFVCFLVTGRYILAKDVGSEVVNGELKNACRRTVKYISIIFNRLTLADDNLFYYPKTEKPDVLANQNMLIDKLLRQKHLDEHEYIRLLSEKLVVQSGYINHVIMTLGPTEKQCEINKFFTLANNYLDRVIKTRPQKAIVEGSDENQRNKQSEINFIPSGMECLRDFHELMQANNFEWFVTGGTCLGLARHNTLLRHDFDVDVGMFAEYATVVDLMSVISRSDNFLSQKIENFDKVHHNGGDWQLSKDPAFLKLIHRNGVNLDIFFHYASLDSKSVIHGSPTVCWSNTPFQLGTGKIGNLDVQHPVPLERYLTEHYGDWKVVKKEFSCVTDTTNIHVNPSFSSIAQLLRRLSPDVAHKFPDRESLIRSFTASGVLRMDQNSLKLNKELFIGT